MVTVADRAGAWMESLPATLNRTYSVTRTEVTHPWFALRVREKLRETTEQHLGAIDCELFSPATTEVRQWSDRRKIVRVPLFSGYLFCRFNPECQLRILQTLGVIDLVRVGARPAVVDPLELAAIRQALELQKPIEAFPHLVCGQAVRVVCGPMAGVEGTLAMIKSEWKLVLAVTMMNSSVAVEIDRSQVEAV